ncbi:sigma-70 family RNA polymerase sigma factor [Mesorhizobium sp. B2-8-3]|uniref:sigma-70 family RNA polymerase sigma factor n=1 Tax=Mesorhizobium sp. B2-8-3 TaxID=2589905 RepID=UPI00112B89A8|nr:sigma-70 family RNA polymerase sigma factor [Mesorhizobium sp. B2-8-3]TPJ37164.1 sigma-70 family RNA polymerase sigma factor [Mesorhizobium sp. B2-8-3]
MDDLILEVEPMIPALRRYARGLLHDPTSADDLLQDCLERVITHWQQRRGEHSRAWVFTILHNLAINRLRQASRRGQHIPLEEISDDLLVHRATQEDGLRGAEIMSALQQLPEEQRSVLLLISVEDLAYAEAAEVLAIPIGTVMSRLSRGRERLRQILENPASGAKPGSHLRRVK